MDAEKKRRLNYMSLYLVAKHAYVCLSGDHVVVLDLRNDKYLALKPEESAGLETLLPGWPCRPNSVMTTATSDIKSRDRVLEELIQKGLVTTNSRLGKSLSPLNLKPAKNCIVTDITYERQPLHFTAAFSYCASAFTAWSMLRFLPIERLMMRVKRRMDALRASSTNCDSTVIKRLISNAELVRPFIFTATNACLFESFALLTYLSRNGVAASWVFGVQTAPFSAHCWLQYDHAVLNDTVEHTRSYTPIMVI